MDDIKHLPEGTYDIVLEDCECFDCWKDRVLK